MKVIPPDARHRRGRAAFGRMPRWRRHATILIVLAGVLNTAAGAQGARDDTVGNRLAGLRVGNWIQLEGMARGTGPIACSVVRPLTGDFLDDDCTLKGLITAVDVEREEFTICATRVRLSRATVFDSRDHTVHGMSDIRPGMIVDVEGTFLKDGVLLAAEVDDESDELVSNPPVRQEVEVTGKIERIDRRRHVVTVMGIEFQVSGRTRLLSAIR